MAGSQDGGGDLDESVSTLGNAYRLKESFYTIYDAKDAKEAKERYAAWRAGIPADQEAIWSL